MKKTMTAKATRAAHLLKLDLRHFTYRDGSVAWFVVGDPCAGTKHVYTVYRILLAGDKRSEAIGRELDLVTARDLVRREMEHLRLFGLQDLQRLPS